MIKLVLRKLLIASVFATLALGIFAVNYSKDSGLTVAPQANAQTLPDNCTYCLINCYFMEVNGAPPEQVQQCVDNCYASYCR